MKKRIEHLADGRKVCTKCGAPKELSDFYERKLSWDGRATICKACICPPKAAKVACAVDPRIKLWRNAKSRAIRLKIPFAITIEDIAIPSVCPVFGIPLVRGTKYACDGSPSLDRRENALGYIAGNVFVISWKANRRKADLTVGEIRGLAQYVGLL